jgi:hypothetical protein
LPLYYEDSSTEGATFLTALSGWWTDAAQRSWAIYPLLSGGRRRAAGGQFWLGGPLFYADHRADTFVSPLYASWTSGEGRARALPALLSACDRDEAAGKRKFSLLWRLFRYERSPEKRAVDRLFVPVWRS